MRNTDGGGDVLVRINRAVLAGQCAFNWERTAEDGS